MNAPPLFFVFFFVFKLQNVPCMTRAPWLQATLRWGRPRPEAVEATDSHGEGGNRLLGSYGANALKSLARSHPEVMSRHHPDLEVKPDGTVVRR